MQYRLRCNSSEACESGNYDDAYMQGYEDGFMDGNDTFVDLPRCKWCGHFMDEHGVFGECRYGNRQDDSRDMKPCSCKYPEEDKQKPGMV